MGLVETLAEYYPESDWQRCTVHFYRNVWAKVPYTKIKEVVAMLKAVHAQEDREAAVEKSKLVAAKLRAMKLPARLGDAPDTGKSPNICSISIIFVCTSD